MEAITAAFIVQFIVKIDKFLRCNDIVSVTMAGFTHGDPVYRVAEFHRVRKQPEIIETKEVITGCLN